MTNNLFTCKEVSMKPQKKTVWRVGEHLEMLGKYLEMSGEGMMSLWCSRILWCCVRNSQVVLVVKNLPDNAGDIRRCRFDPWVRKIPKRRKQQSIALFLPGESLGQRSLEGYRVSKSWTKTEVNSVQFSSVQLLSPVRLFVTP